MSRKNIGKYFGFAASAVHVGNEADGETGAIRKLITMANSYELPYDLSDLNWNSAEGNIYRNRTVVFHGRLSSFVKDHAFHVVNDWYDIVTIISEAAVGWQKHYRQVPLIPLPEK